jgi:hypothetical protein
MAELRVTYYERDQSEGALAEVSYESFREQRRSRRPRSNRPSDGSDVIAEPGPTGSNGFCRAIRRMRSGQTGAGRFAHPVVSSASNWTSLALSHR